MNNGWPIVPLATVVRHRKEFVTIDDTHTYKRCRVQLHAKGIVLRDMLPGAEIKTKDQQVCRAGEFLVAEIDAKVGGFGIVPQDLEGAIVSSHYFLFVVDEVQLDRRFLDYWIRTPAFREQVTARGTTNYAAIRPAHVLAYTVPLPPLPEQRRIVAKVEELAAKIEEAKACRSRSQDEVGGMAAAALRSFRNQLLVGNQRVAQLGEITTVTAGGTPSRDDLSYWNGNIPWIKTGELLDGDISSAEEHITEAGLANSSAKLFPSDTILIALYGQGQTRGRTGRLLSPATTNQACCAILPTPSLLEPRYTQYWLRSLYHELREQCHGGAQPNWNGQMVKSLTISVPPLQIQRDAIAYLDELQAKVDCLKALQAQTRAELDALLPSILDKAFKGEL